MDRNQNTRLTLTEWLKKNGYDSLEDALAEFNVSDSTAPALCREGCQVEPDGHCPHAAPSILLELGLI